MHETGRLSFNRIIFDLKAVAPKQVYQALSDIVASDCGLKKDSLLALLNAAQRKGTAGVGGGVAIAHLQMNRIEKPYLAFARLSRLIDFDALDRHPVDLVCLLLSPRADGVLHLQKLSRLSRMMRDENIVRNLRSVETEDGLRVLLQQQDDLSHKAAA